MDHPKRGVFIIINNKKFHSSVDQSERSGTDVDADNLCQVFTGLGFDVRQENNNTTAEMLAILVKGKGVCCCCCCCCRC